MAVVLFLEAPAGWLGLDRRLSQCGPEPVWRGTQQSGSGDHWEAQRGGRGGHGRYLSGFEQPVLGSPRQFMGSKRRAAQPTYALALLLDDMRLLSGTRLRDLKSEELLNTIQSQPLRRNHQTWDGRPQRIVLVSPQVEGATPQPV